MLMLTINDESPIHIGTDITITIKRHGGRTKLLIEAPKEIKVLRDQVYKRIHAMPRKL